ncbi:MAG: WbqC family protein [Ignavibacteria bacterium]
MKIAVMQPYLFPYIGYFQLINSVDKFVIYDDVSFINKGWINRNNILVNGKPNLFTVPLKKSSQNKLIKDIEISDPDTWRTKFLKTIEVSYSKADSFKDVYALITDVLHIAENNISKLILNSLTAIKNYLEIKTEIIESSAMYCNSQLKGFDRIIDICKKEDSNNYINPIGGINIYSKKIFEDNGIKLNFIKPKEILYRQFDQEFVPSLSIIDVLMFNSKKKVQDYLNEYDLI